MTEEARGRAAHVVENRMVKRRWAAWLLLPIPLLLCLIFVVLCLSQPVESGTTSTATAPGARIAERFTDAKRAALEGLAFVEKVYRLPEDMQTGITPDEDAYGDTTDKGEVSRVIAAAAPLLGGQETIWSPEIELRENSSIHYYRDETILALTWQETMDEKVTVTFAEVKIADASQLRRKLAGDVYGSPIKKFPAELAEECRAVLATSADFYRYQKKGVHVYRGELYRCDGLDTLDVCFFDRGGDMLFVHAGTFADEAAVRQYIAENDILFSLCFGPIVIEDGIEATPPNYPLGETGQFYSRCLMAQVDELHYLTMVVYTESMLKSAVRYLMDKGITHAYSLDGGQTGSIILGGEHMNPFQYKSPRIQSDILWYATAVPEN